MSRLSLAFHTPDSSEILVGVLSGGSINDDGDGTITVDSGYGFIRATDSDLSTLFSFGWPQESGANVTLIDNDMNYIYVEYNAGVPQVISTTTELTDVNTNILLGTVYRIGIVLHITVDTKAKVDNGIFKTIDRFNSTEPFAWESGAMVSETGTLKIAVTPGTFWQGLTRFTTASFDSNGADTFTYTYRDGSGGWTFVPASTQIDNLKYDDGSGTLATLGMFSRYGVHWVYIENDSDIYVVYGEGTYKLKDATEMSQKD